MENYIPLRKRRELGAILSDTFAFSRNNSKQLFSVLVKTCGIPFIVVLVASAYYQYVMLDPDPVSMASNIMIALLALALAGGIFYAMSASTIFSFTHEYEVNRGVVEESTVIDQAKSKFGSMVLLMIICYMMMAFGFIFFVIPGIYFIVPVVLAFPLMIFREKSIGETISESFRLTKGYWWVTFGTILVISIIIGLISFAFSMPSLIYMLIKTVISASQSSIGSPEMPNDFIYMILATIGSAASYVLTVVMHIAIGFVYYDLDEEKNKTGIRQQIDELGS
ncbi:hypothetical protein ACFSKL_08790 [Belliella marina]|uniref:Glycerophosphoryl diester phosphodiesterase membrane domain-containing protein n=1 Tax=Belliella marina TaxID=1644146 RepID=A0ABW4VJK2_9BACT